MKTSFNIIRTKLIIPEPRKNYISRKSALSILKESADFKLTILKGTAGSGKTTLMSSYIKENKLSRVKWISLDKENNESYSFWYYFCEAVKDIITDNNIFDFFNETLKQDSFFNLVIYIVNELSKVDSDIFIVLDDFYHIKDEFLNSTIDYLIKYSSSNVHYIIMTREEPLLHLGELRVQDEVLEIGESDLKFTKNETSSLVKETLKLTLDDNTIEELLKESEGWIAGIQLIALTYKNNRSLKPSSLSRENKYMADYLSEEIINALTSREKDFLVKTSILNYFTPDFCNELLDIDSAEYIINSLLDKNIFIITVDIANQVYRYHNMFRDFLNSYFLKLPESDKKDLHIKAYKIYKDQNNYQDAVSHLIEIKAYDLASSELNENLKNQKGWYYLKQIPVKYLLSFDELLIQRLYYHFANMQLAEFKDILNTVNTDEHSILNVFNIFIRQFENANIDELLSIDIDESGFNITTKSILYITLLYILNYRNDYKKVLDYSHKYYMVAEKYNMTTLKFFIQEMQSIALEDMGELLKVLNMYNEQYDYITRTSFSSIYMPYYYIGIAGVYIKMCEVEKAEAEINKLCSINESIKDMFSTTIMYHNIIIKFLEDDTEEGLKLCSMLKEKERLSLGIIIDYKISLDLYTEDELKEYIDMYEKEIMMSSFNQIIHKISYARSLYLLGEHDKGIQILSDIIENCRENHINTYLVDSLIHMLIILCSDFGKNKREIINYLREAMEYSADNSYLLPFVLEYSKISLVIDVLKEDQSLTTKEKKFIDKLDDIDRIKHNKNQTLLSNREQEVLAVLAQGLTNKEIAENLNISLSTVKTHIIKIYSKLNVSSRLQAIEKAKSLSLI